MNYLFKRSDTPNKRPVASSMISGEILMNNSVESPALFFKLADDSLCLLGPPSVSSTAPNSTPAGSSGNAKGEMWFDTSTAQTQLKVYDGSSWLPAYGNPIPVFSEVSSNTLMVGFSSVSGGQYTGSYNTLLSDRSSLTTGSYNTFMGYACGLWMTTGSYNTILGSGAASQGGVTGSYATIAGHNAAGSAPNIEKITAIGAQSLFLNRGEGNIGIGYQAGYNTTTGEYNIAIGLGALYSNKSGSNNIAIGKDCLKNLTNTSDTIAIGSEAGDSLLEGSTGNILFGYLAGPAKNAASPCNNNIFFGQKAGTGLRSGQNNVFFGNNCFERYGYSSTKNLNNCTLIGSLPYDAIPDGLDNYIIIGNEWGTMLSFNSVGGIGLGHAMDFGVAGAPLVSAGVSRASTGNTGDSTGAARWFNDGPTGNFISQDNKRVEFKYGLITSITQL